MDEAMFPWQKVVQEKLWRSFPEVNEETLQLLHESIIEEFKTFDWNDKYRGESFYATLRHFYLHFSWKVNWNEVTCLKQSCIQILYFLSYVGLVFSNGNLESEWLNEILLFLRTFPGDPYVKCDILLLIRNMKQKFHSAYAVVLRSILFDDNLIEPVDAESCIKILLLFRRLKSLSKSDIEQADISSFTSKIKCPPDVISWISSLNIDSLCGITHKNLTKKLLKRKLKWDIVQKLFKVLFDNKYDESIINPLRLFSQKITSSCENESIDVSYTDTKGIHKIKQNKKLPKMKFQGEFKKKKDKKETQLQQHETLATSTKNAIDCNSDAVSNKLLNQTVVQNYVHSSNSKMCMKKIKNSAFSEPSELSTPRIKRHKKNSSHKLAEEFLKVMHKESSNELNKDYSTFKNKLGTEEKHETNTQTNTNLEQHLMANELLNKTIIQSDIQNSSIPEIFGDGIFKNSECSIPRIKKRKNNESLSNKLLSRITHDNQNGIFKNSECPTPRIKRHKKISLSENENWSHEFDEKSSNELNKDSPTSNNKIDPEKQHKTSSIQTMIQSENDTFPLSPDNKNIKICHEKRSELEESISQKSGIHNSDTQCVNASISNNCNKSAKKYEMVTSSRLTLNKKKCIRESDEYCCSKSNEVLSICELPSKDIHINLQSDISLVTSNVKDIKETSIHLYDNKMQYALPCHSTSQSYSAVNCKTKLNEINNNICTEILTEGNIPENSLCSSLQNKESYAGNKSQISFTDIPKNSLPDTPIHPLLNSVTVENEIEIGDIESSKSKYTPYMTKCGVFSSATQVANNELELCQNNRNLLKLQMNENIDISESQHCNAEEISDCSEIIDPLSCTTGLFSSPESLDLKEQSHISVIPLPIKISERSQSIYTSGDSLMSSDESMGDVSTISDLNNLIYPKQSITENNLKGLCIGVSKSTRSIRRIKKQLSKKCISKSSSELSDEQTISIHTSPKVSNSLIHSSINSPGDKSLKIQSDTLHSPENLNCSLINSSGSSPVNSIDSKNSKATNPSGKKFKQQYRSKNIISESSSESSGEQDISIHTSPKVSSGLTHSSVNSPVDKSLKIQSKTVHSPKSLNLNCSLINSCGLFPVNSIDSKNSKATNPRGKKCKQQYRSKKYISESSSESSGEQDISIHTSPKVSTKVLDFSCPGEDKDKVSQNSSCANTKCEICIPPSSEACINNHHNLSLQKKNPKQNKITLERSFNISLSSSRDSSPELKRKSVCKRKYFVLESDSDASDNCYVNNDINVLGNSKNSTTNNFSSNIYSMKSCLEVSPSSKSNCNTKNSARKISSKLSSNVLEIKECTLKFDKDASNNSIHSSKSITPKSNSSSSIFNLKSNGDSPNDSSQKIDPDDIQYSFSNKNIAGSSLCSSEDLPSKLKGKAVHKVKYKKIVLDSENGTSEKTHMPKNTQRSLSNKNIKLHSSRNSSLKLKRKSVHKFESKKYVLEAGDQHMLNSNKKSLSNKTVNSCLSKNSSLKPTNKRLHKLKTNKFVLETGDQHVSNNSQETLTDANIFKDNSENLFPKLPLECEIQQSDVPEKSNYSSPTSSLKSRSPKLRYNGKNSKDKEVLNKNVCYNRYFSDSDSSLSNDHKIKKISINSDYSENNLNKICQNKLPESRKPKSYKRKSSRKIKKSVKLTKHDIDPPSDKVLKNNHMQNKLSEEFSGDSDIPLSELINKMKSKSNISNHSDFQALPVNSNLGHLLKMNSSENIQQNGSVLDSFKYRSQSEIQKEISSDSNLTLPGVESSFVDCDSRQSPNEYRNSTEQYEKNLNKNLCGAFSAELLDNRQNKGNLVGKVVSQLLASEQLQELIQQSLNSQELLSSANKMCKIQTMSDYEKNMNDFIKEKEKLSQEILIDEHLSSIMEKLQVDPNSFILEDCAKNSFINNNLDSSIKHNFVHKPPNFTEYSKPSLLNRNGNLIQTNLSFVIPHSNHKKSDNTQKCDLSCNLANINNYSFENTESLNEKSNELRETIGIYNSSQLLKLPSELNTQILLNTRGECLCNECQKNDRNFDNQFCNVSSRVTAESGINVNMTQNPNSEVFKKKLLHYSGNYFENQHHSGNSLENQHHSGNYLENLHHSGNYLVNQHHSGNYLVNQHHSDKLSCRELPSVSEENQVYKNNMPKTNEKIVFVSDMVNKSCEIYHLPEEYSFQFLNKSNDHIQSETLHKSSNTCTCNNSTLVTAEFNNEESNTLINNSSNNVNVPPGHLFENGFQMSTTSLSPVVNLCKLDGTIQMTKCILENNSNRVSSNKMCEEKQVEIEKEQQDASLNLNSIIVEENHARKAVSKTGKSNLKNNSNTGKDEMAECILENEWQDSSLSFIKMTKNHARKVCKLNSINIGEDKNNLRYNLRSRKTLTKLCDTCDTCK